VKLSIRNVEPDELEGIFMHIKNDFALGEYPPYAALHRHLTTGVQKGYILQDRKKDVAYSFCAEGTGNGFVLISLLAVFKEFRGKGYGTAFLDELRHMYTSKKGIIIEVEKPEEAKTADEKTVREKRIAFYQKSGFYLVKNIDYCIWDIPMHLMILPGTGTGKIDNAEISQAIYEIYGELLGDRFIHKVRLRLLK